MTAIAQTQGGYLWLGTKGGLARFDGLHFTIFEKNNTPDLQSNFITSLLVDHEGTLRIGTHNGLTRYSGGALRTYKTKDGLIGNDIRQPVMVCQIISYFP